MALWLWSLEEPPVSDRGEEEAGQRSSSDLLGQNVGVSGHAKNLHPGIGLMMTKALEQNGAKVYIVGRRKELLEKVANEEAVRPGAHMCSYCRAQGLWQKETSAEN